MQEKFYAVFDNNLQQMRIEKLNETALNNRDNYEKINHEYNSLPVFNTIEGCIKSLGNYSKPVRIFDGRTIIPDAINYPQLQIYYILKPVLFPIAEF